MSEAATELTAESAMLTMCHGWVDQAADMRAVTRPGHTAPPDQVHQKLLEVRGRLDRLESILAEAAATRSGARIRARELAEEADDAWDAEINRLAQQAVHRDFEGAQERYAKARLKVLPQRRKARTAQRVADVVSDTEDGIRAAYRGLRDLREELLATLRYLQWESAMER